jgi:hypothetical protein
MGRVCGWCGEALPAGEACPCEMDDGDDDWEDDDDDDLDVSDL